VEKPKGDRRKEKQKCQKKGRSKKDYEEKKNKQKGGKRDNIFGVKKPARSN